MSIAAKKRRRSSLAAAKIKIDLLSPFASGLHNQVDISFPPERRFEQLTNLCLKHAVECVRNETEFKNDDDNFERVLNEIPQLLQAAEFQKAYQKVCHGESVLPDSVNEEIDEEIQMLEEKIIGLHQEEKDWLEYLAELDKQIEVAESKAQQKVLSPLELTDQQHSFAKSFLPKLSDLSVLKRNVNDSTKKSYVLFRDHEKLLHQLQQYLQVNQCLDKKMTYFHEMLKCTVGSPRKYIENVIEL